VWTRPLDPAGGSGSDTIRGHDFDLHLSAHPAKGGPLLNVDLYGTRVRADSATYVGKHQAAIFTQVRPYFSLRRNDQKVAGAAKHIWDAYNNPGATRPKRAGKSIPGNVNSKTFLHRVMNQSQSDSNRGASKAWCVKEFGADYPKNGTYDCDEFPFASVREGTKTGAQQGGRADFSVRPVLSGQNQEAGRRLGLYYINDRILRPDDPFQVHNPRLH
jgi:hypothetical protein